MNNLNLSSMRAKRARLGNKIGTMGRDLLVLAVFIFGLMALFFGYQYKFGSLFYLFLAMALTSIVLACWQQYDLSMPAGNLASDKLEDLLKGLDGDFVKQALWQRQQASIPPVVNTRVLKPVGLELNPDQLVFKQKMKTLLKGMLG